MDKSVLNEYVKMQEEVKDLRKRKLKLEREIKKIEEEGAVSDVVRGGMGGVEHFKVSGFPIPEHGRKKSLLKRRKALLEQKEEELLELMTKTEEYIDTIPQSDLRMIFRFRYIDGMEWSKVAINMNYHFPNKKVVYTEDGCRMRHNRFIEKENT